jgi:hypothetical protein
MPNPYVSPLLVDIADGAQILNTVTETIVAADYAFSVNDPRIFQGAAFNIRCWFDVSNVVTTPGTLTLRVRWGGVAGTLLASTGAIALSVTARSNYAGSLDADLVVRSIGSAGSMFCMGRAFLNDVPVAADSLPQNPYTLGSAGANVPAVVSAINFTTGSQALSVTAQFSVATATTQLTNHIRILKAISS